MNVAEGRVCINMHFYNCVGGKRILSVHSPDIHSQMTCQNTQLCSLGLQHIQLQTTYGAK